MISQQVTIDVCANNLANVGTTGFKKSRSNFQDMMYQTTKLPGATTSSGGTVPVGIQVGMGAKPSSTQKIHTQGDYENTGNELDFAIEGKGFQGPPRR
jgi:flagellar basal-body rod protein FlgG